MSTHNGPPLMVNRGFFEDKRIVFKICQIVVGIFCAIVNSYCFPNAHFLICTSMFHSFPQLFSLLVVNVFFVVLTAVMVVFDLFGVHDAYYKYNFYLMEKMFASLASAMYAVSLVMTVVAICSSPFIAQWLLTLFGTLLNTVLYGFDAYTRWRDDPTRFY